MKVEFSELALAGIRRELPDPSRQKTCYVHLEFYLRRDHGKHSLRCPAFDDVDVYQYIFGRDWRVLYEVQATRVLIWSFAIR